jgi:hypothetical protein
MKNSTLISLFFLEGLSLNKADTLLLEPQLQSILLWLFWRQGLKNYLLGLALNFDLPDLCLLSSWDYTHEPPVPHYN